MSKIAAPNGDRRSSLTTLALYGRSEKGGPGPPDTTSARRLRVSGKNTGEPCRTDVRPASGGRNEAHARSARLAGSMPGRGRTVGADALFES